MANTTPRRMLARLCAHRADLCLIAAVLAVLAASWQEPARPAPGGLQAAARTAVNRHLGGVEHVPAEPALQHQEQTARAAARPRDPG